MAKEAQKRTNAKPTTCCVTRWTCRKDFLKEEIEILKYTETEEKLHENFAVTDDGERAAACFVLQRRQVKALEKIGETLNLIIELQWTNPTTL